MQEPEEKLNISNNQAFTLWRLFDHTRFMISRIREKELNQFGLTPEQTRILDILAHNNGPTSINFIVEVTQRQHHSISTQIDRMFKMGLVTRNRTPEDARKYEVCISNRGLDALKKITHQSIENIFSVLSEVEKEQFRDNLLLLLNKSYSLNKKTPRKHFTGK